MVVVVLVEKWRFKAFLLFFFSLQKNVVKTNINFDSAARFKNTKETIFGEYTSRGSVSLIFV